MKNVKKSFETCKPSKKVINEKVNKIKNDANEKTKKLLITKFRGAAIIIGLKNKMLKDSNFRNIEILPTHRIIAEGEGKKILLFTYKETKYDGTYYYSNNEETFHINNERSQNTTLNHFEIKDLEDLKVIEAILAKIKETELSNF